MAKILKDSLIPKFSVNLSTIKSKVIIEKSCGEVSLMEQDTIEFIRNIFEVYGGFIGQKILKL